MKLPFLYHAFWMAFLLLVPLSNHDLMAQNQADSLKNLLEINLGKRNLKNLNEFKAKDTSIVNYCSELGLSLLNSNPDAAIEYTLSGFKIAKKLNYNKGIAGNGKLLGSLNYQKGDYPLALQYLDTAMTFAIRTGNKEIIAQIYGSRGNCYTQLSNYPEALKAQFNALKLYEELKKVVKIGDSYLNIASIYTSQKKYKEAIPMYLNSLKIYEKEKDESGRAIVFINLGVIYMYSDSLDNAIKYYNRAKTIFNSLNDKFGNADIHVKLGLAYKYKMQLDSSLSYFSKALYFAEEVNHNRVMAATLSNMASVLVIQKKYNEAKVLVKKALAISSKYKYLSFLTSHYQLLTQIDSSQGNYKGAFENYKLQKAYSDSVFNENKIKEQTEIQMNFEFEKRTALAKAEQEKKDEITRAEIRKQKFIRNSVLGGLVILTLFSIVVFRQRNRISKEKKRSEELLLNILPEQVAEELKQKGETEARQIDEATVLFTDFKGFTALSEKLSPKELVKDLHECFTAFDNIIQKHGLEKIKTIGDAYMAAGGLPTANNTHALDTVKAALEIIDFVEEGKAKKIAAGLPYFEIRIGIHTGPVVAGIVGVKKFSYDIWGDTVNTASRMESSGEVGKVNISGTTYEWVKDKFKCIHRGKISAKGKGEVDMYFVEK